MLPSTLQKHHAFSTKLVVTNSCHFDRAKPLAEAAHPILITFVCGSLKCGDDEAVPEPHKVRAPSRLLQAGSVSVLRSVGTSVVAERIHPSVILNVWVSHTALVRARINILSEWVLARLTFAARASSSVCRLSVSADVLLLGIGVSAHRILLTGLFRAGRILLNRLFRLAADVPLNLLCSAYLVALDRFAGSRSVLVYGVTMSRRFVLRRFDRALRLVLNRFATTRRILLNGIVRTESALFADRLSLGTRFILDACLVLDARLTLDV